MSLESQLRLVGYSQVLNNRRNRAEGGKDMRERILLVFVCFMVAGFFGPSSEAISNSGNTQISTSLQSTFAMDTSSSVSLGVHGGGNWQPGQPFDGNQIILISANDKWTLSVYDSSPWNNRDGHMHLVGDSSKELKSPLNIMLNPDVKPDNNVKPIPTTFDLKPDSQPVATSKDIGNHMMEVVYFLQPTSSNFDEASGNYQISLTFVVAAAV